LAERDYPETNPEKDDGFLCVCHFKNIVPQSFLDVNFLFLEKSTKRTFPGANPPSPPAPAMPRRRSAGPPFCAPSRDSEGSLDPKLGKTLHFEEIVAEMGTIVPFSRLSLDLFAF
jgi:hypothetical protein